MLSSFHEFRLHEFSLKLRFPKQVVPLWENLCANADTYTLPLCNSLSACACGGRTWRTVLADDPAGQFCYLSLFSESRLVSTATKGGFELTYSWTVGRT